jgi:HEAT repeats
VAFIRKSLYRKLRSSGHDFSRAVTAVCSIRLRPRRLRSGNVAQTRKSLIVLLLGSVLVTAAHAQLQGHISMAKQEYLAGEPIYVHFEVTNSGKQAVQYASGDPYMEKCGGYRVDISSGPPLLHSSCQPVAPEECTATAELLAPGETLRQNILVNYAHDVAKPGTYSIHAVRTVKYGPMTTGEVASLTGNFQVEAQFQIELYKADTNALKSIYQVYVNNLESQDPDIQREAERAIVSGAPPWLEDTIVGMMRRYTSREFALLGLRNLNTPRAREELSKLVQNTSEYTPENEAAVGYLAQMGDKKYFPMLRDLAVKQPPDQGREYVLAAAELGVDDAIPFLKTMLNSKDSPARANAVAGLEKTGSRDAVPVLIEALKTSDTSLGRLVLNSLAELTHRTAGPADGDPPAEEYGRWETWWTANGATAVVYGPRQCGELQKLP